MDGIHDMGGMHGFGAVEREENEPVFHADWEKRAFGLSLQAGEGIGFVDDHLRANIERIPAVTYLRSSYYELWTRATQSIAVQRGILTDAEIAERIATLSEPGRAEGGSEITLDEMDAAMAAGASTKRAEVKVDAGFKAGDRVWVKNDHPRHHTRATRYCRGRAGEVVMDHGVFVFPDSNSEQEGENPEHCYSVRFLAEELWGDASTPGDAVYVDLWESYLVSA
ncbi:MAG: nitrile hydratase subunit beta [Alphaproteobacteria bacterium]|jgi:nitrile hydratase subunit beta|nr:nitrile hydratase subunit beta [Rhodospirillaceae bacterium]MBT6202129.1 nitrile hydratase subunit beta [Rhodospirillaceae bacterium]MBT6513075.1 nitrile hydratase subunit beta [Rhodospirillaceae bacterium]MDG2479635.1 nitrile hydratase subunit beta [Alphaproteobacteria bacterium]